MKKWMFIVIVVIALLILFFNFFVNIDGGCDPPEKPINVPSEAVWAGGCDGGYWIELVAIEKDKVRFRIYRDWNGDLILDADFEYKDCNDFRLTNSNWTEYIAYFGNTIELMDKAGINERCRLEPIYPAYKEEKLE